MLLLLASAVLAQRPSAVVSPYQQAQPLAIRSVSETPEALKQFEMVEWKVGLSATFGNPFDPAEVSLDAEVRTPAGKVVKVPGFFFRDFERSLEQDQEVLKAAGEPEWRLRFAPSIPGRHQVTISAKDKSGAVQYPSFSFDVAEGENPGFVRVSEVDARYFAFDNGKPYWPLGPNICWPSGKGTYDYDEWLPKYAEQGVNYSRLWLSPSWTAFALEQPGKPAEGKGMGFFDLGNAWRLDYVLRSAQSRGIYLMLCIDSYNVLRSKDAFNWWEKTPHNQDQGGPLRTPGAFWTDQRMSKLYKDKLRYLAARYGAYTSTMSWEFWNEVDLVDDFEIQEVTTWHREMGKFMRSVDPYDHLLTTSAAHTMGFRQLDLLPELDYYQTHHYGLDPALTTLIQQSRKGGLGSPHYVGEIGADAAGPRVEDDPEGIQIHDPIWASIASGSSGNASGWWWDSLIAPKELYGIYGAAHRFVEDMNWPEEGFRQRTPTFAYTSAPAGPVMMDLEFGGGPVEWRDNPINKPKQITIRNGQATGPLPISGVLHGRTNHPTWHNPVAFDVVLAQPTRFEVIVGDVSGHGGATLYITLNGDRVLSREFADPDGIEKTDALKQYAGVYGFTVPKGRHTIVVSNPGKDWMYIDYRFQKIVPRTKPEVEGWSVIGETHALAWIRREGRSWRRAVAKEKLAAAPPTVMGLTGLASGRWKVEVWDTWVGKPTHTVVTTIGLDGKVRVNLPSISRDVAVKLTKQ